MGRVKERRVPNRMLFEEPNQMIGRGAIAINGLHRGTQHLLMMLQSIGAKVGDAERFDRGEGNWRGG